MHFYFCIYSFVPSILRHPILSSSSSAGKDRWRWHKSSTLEAAAARRMDPDLSQTCIKV